MRRNRITVFFLSIFILLVWTGSGAAVQPYPVGQPGKTAVSAKGTVKQAGSQFFLSSPEFKQQLLILNPDAKLLGDLASGGRTVTVQGYLSTGADGVLIVKIDGVPYGAVKRVPNPVGSGGPYPVGKGTPK